MEFWGKIGKGQAKMKAKDRVDDEVNAIWDSIVEEDATLKKAAAGGKNQPTESLSLSKIPFPATMEFWGKIWKGQAKMKAKDRVDDELNAIWDSIVEEDAALKKAAACGNNQPISKIPFPATMEFWGKIGKGHAKMKAKDGVDDEVNAIFASIVEEDATLKMAAVSGKKRSTESLSLSKIPLFPATMEFWGKIGKGQAKMKAKDGVDDEVNAIFASIVEEDATLKKAVVSGKKRPSESASKTPATEKKAKLISPAGQKTGPTSDNALQAHTKAKHSATK